MESNIPHKAEITAEVNTTPALVPLYAPDGAVIHVAEADVATWLKRGFAREAADLDALLAEAEALADALIAPWREYVLAFQETGRIDDAAQTTAHAAVDLLSDALNRLHLAIHASVKPEPEPADTAAEEEEE